MIVFMSETTGVRGQTCLRILLWLQLFRKCFSWGTTKEHFFIANLIKATINVLIFLVGQIEPSFLLSRA